MVSRRLKSPRPKLSVVLATRNEEKNIGSCLASVKNLADEIVVIDESSVDKTREIAWLFGAKVYKETHEPIFHVTKQKALDRARGEWILQLDADERVTPGLAQEIRKVISLDSRTIKKRRPADKKKWKLFVKHQQVLEKRDGVIGKRTGEIAAFFLPRLNYFLGKPLVHAGVYPDGVIRLIKKNRAYFPAQSVHEQIQVKGEVAWLFHDLEHYDSPTLKRYFQRMNRYTKLHVDEFKLNKVSRGPFGWLYYFLVKPWQVFLNLFVRHKGFLDGYRGFLWSSLSASHFPVAYFKYLRK